MLSSRHLEAPLHDLSRKPSLEAISSDALTPTGSSVEYTIAALKALHRHYKNNSPWYNRVAWRALQSSVMFQLVYEEPGQVFKGLGSVKRMLETEGCNIASGPSWVVASCKGLLIKARVTVEGGLDRVPLGGVKGLLVLVAEGEPEDLVKASRMALSVAQETGGGLIMA